MSEQGDINWKIVSGCFFLLIILIVGVTIKDICYECEQIQKPVTIYKAPKPETLVIRYGQDHEPYLMGEQWEQWIKSEKSYSCIPGQNPKCGTTFTINGKNVDYWEWEKGKK